MAWIIPSVVIIGLGAACMCLMLRYCKGRGTSEEVLSPRSVQSYRRGARNDNTTTVDCMPGDGLGDATATISSSRLSGKNRTSGQSNRSTENYQLELQPDSQVRHPNSLEDDEDDYEEEDVEYGSDSYDEEGDEEAD